MLVDSGSIVDILYWDAYKRMGLTKNDLSPTTSLLCGFTRDHVISRDTIKLAMTVGEHPRVSIVMTKFVAVDYPLAFNRVIRR